MAPQASISPPSQHVRPVLHTIALASHLHALYQLLNFHLPLPGSNSWWFHTQFLTVWALVLSILTFALAISLDLIVSLRDKQKDSRDSDAIFEWLAPLKATLSSIAAPASILVTILYFGLKAISRGYVVPDWAILPLSLDLSLHVAPMMFQLSDYLGLPPSPISPTEATGGVRKAGRNAGALALAYWLRCERARRVWGTYPYPIMDEAGGWGRMGLFVGSAGIMMGIAVALEGARGWLWGRGGNGKERGEKR